MSEVFGSGYADAYDAIYAEKNYSRECDAIEGLIAEFGSILSVRRILDLGCGTGGHTIPLARRGYSVTGIDRSGPMLMRARSKASAARVEDLTDFREGDVQEIRLNGPPFDAAIMMFAVLGYQRTGDEVRAALMTVRAHLDVGAPFVFDIWHGPGVLADKPGRREIEVPVPGGHLVRRATGALDEKTHLCAVRYELERWEGAQCIKSTHEEHAMRYFFRDELDAFASECGFKLATLRQWPQWCEPADERAWAAAGVFLAK